MKSLRFGRWRDGRVELLPDGSREDRGPVLLSAADYTIGILDFPPLPEKEIEGAVAFKVRSLYPGNPDASLVHVHAIRLPGAVRASVAIAQADTLKAYREAAAGGQLVTGWSLGRPPDKGRRELSYRLILGLRELEAYAYSYALPKTAIAIDAPDDMEEGMAAVCAEAIDSLGAGEGALIEAFAYRGRAPALRSALDANGLQVVVVSDIDALRRAGESPVFSRPTSPWLRRLAAILPALALFASANFLIARWASVAEEGAAAYKAAAAGSLSLAERARSTQATLDKLRARLETIRAPASPSPYRILSALRLIGGEGLSISSFVSNGASFTIEASARDPLLLVKRLTDSGRFDKAEISQIRPGGSGGMFSLSGEYHDR